MTIDFDADTVTPGIQPLDLSVVEPDLTITKTANLTSLPPGETVTFSVLLDHSVQSSSDAYDLVVVDTLLLSYVCIFSVTQPSPTPFPQTVQFQYVV